MFFCDQDMARGGKGKSQFYGTDTLLSPKLKKNFPIFVRNAFNI